MKKSVIEFNNVSKRYHLGRKLLLKEALLDVFKSSNDHFWALKDVSFSVKKGETVGIIGKNGSGKSTTLKLMAGVIVPTSGTVTVNGRIAPLIELGAGFHPELSGRENIYINGVVLGLSRKEIEAKFDEIVDFAELASFIDTPVKHYSSGMYVRLGFSIAVNVEPEILLVDEVLSVGDEQFKKKCMAKMDDFIKKGATVVFVSHSMQTVKSFCKRVIYFDHGQIFDEGDPETTVDTYLSRQKEQ